MCDNYYFCISDLDNYKIMKTTRLLLATALTAVLCAASCGRQAEESQLPRAIDESLTGAADQVFNDVRSFTTNELHTLLVVKDGKVVYERYEPGHEKEVRHILWSASKTFTATAVGFAVQDSLLSVDDKVISFFTPSELPQERNPWLEQLTVKNLLTMSSGFEPIHAGIPEAGVDYDWAATELGRPMYFEPGTRFHYDSFDSYLLSVIVSRVTGQRLDEYLDAKLFTPLGITGWYWETSPQNYSAGGWGLYLKPESITKMGQFLLQKGRWEGRQLLSEAWVEEATAPQIMQWAGTDPTPEQLEAYAANDKKCGYGYQVWNCPGGGFRLDGAHGQYCYVFPEKQLVVSCFASTATTQLLRDSIMKNIVSRY